MYLSILLCIVSRFSRAPSYPSSLFFPASIYPANKKAIATILIYSRCTLLCAIAYLDFSHLVRMIILARTMATNYNWMRLMHRKCPPAGKSPDAESCGALRWFHRSLANLWCCCDIDNLCDISIKVSGDYISILEIGQTWENMD